MDTRIVDFTKNNRVSVLTTVLPDGTPHSAALHFASSDDLESFVFWTERNSRKCGHFEIGENYKASLVIGFSEEEMKEFQLEGEVKVVESEELEKVYKIYHSKFGGSEGFEGDENDVLLKFTPKWWRYTEFKPKKFVLESK